MNYKKPRATIVDFTEAMIRNQKFVRGVLAPNPWGSDAASCY